MMSHHFFDLLRRLQRSIGQIFEQLFSYLGNRGNVPFFKIYTGVFSFKRYTPSIFWITKQLLKNLSDRTLRTP